jgi:hypothetical protein
MSQTDEIVLGLVMVGFAICITFSGTAQAWDVESGYAEGEDIETEYVEGYNYFVYHNPESPNWYDPLIDLWIRITSYLFTEEEIEVTVTTTCMKWDGDSYEPDTSTLPEEYGMTLDIPKNQTGTTNIELDPVEEFFKNNTDAMDDFKTRDDDPVHPDILNVSVEISGAGVDISEYGYTSLDDTDMEGISEGISNPDYGFDLDGRGADGGSGSIYEGIDMYGSGAGDESGMGAGFSWIFYGLIPIIFLFAVFKMCQRVLWGGE